MRLRDLIGVDKMIWATDFPHQESEFPHSDRVIATNFAGVPADEVRLMVADNAIHFFHLDGASASDASDGVAVGAAASR